MININLLANDTTTINFSNCIESHHFLPVILKLTRMPPCSSSAQTLLDHIWFNRLNSYSSGIVLSDTTDHMPSYINIPSLSVERGDKIKISFRLQDEAGREKFTDLLHDFDWTTLRSHDVNTYAESFIYKLNELYRSSFPLKTKFISRKLDATPWIND